MPTDSENRAFPRRKTIKIIRYLPTAPVAGLTSRLTGRDARRGRSVRQRRLFNHYGFCSMNFLKLSLSIAALLSFDSTIMSLVLPSSVLYSITALAKLGTIAVCS